LQFCTTLFVGVEIPAFSLCFNRLASL
jgi:hypothetical protein